MYNTINSFNIIIKNIKYFHHWKIKTWHLQSSASSFTISTCCMLGSRGWGGGGLFIPQLTGFCLVCTFKKAIKEFLSIGSCTKGGPKLLCSCLCVFDVVVELHAMDEKMFNDFLIGKWKWFLYVIKAYLINALYFVYVVEAFITLNWKAWYKYMSLFSSMSLVHD